jgi:hypothetical protein
MDMIRKYSYIMYEDKYCEIRLRGMKTKEKLETGLWGDRKDMFWGDEDTHYL